MKLMEEAFIVYFYLMGLLKKVYLTAKSAELLSKGRKEQNLNNLIMRSTLKLSIFVVLKFVIQQPHI